MDDVGVEIRYSLPFQGAVSRHLPAGPRPVTVASTMVQWSEDVIKADPFFGRSRVRFRVPPWVSNTIARDHLA